jgi:hypothetical protein
MVNWNPDGAIEECLHLKNLVVLHHVTRSFWSKILTGCSGYIKSALSSATSGNTTSTGAFIHFFSYDTWKVSCTPTNNGGSSSLYAMSHISQGWETVQCSKVLVFLSFRIFSCPSWVKPWDTHDPQPQTLTVGTPCFHNTLGTILLPLGFLEYYCWMLRPLQQDQVQI